MSCIHIIEDDVDLLQLLTFYFTSQGYNVCDDYNGDGFGRGEDTASDLFLIDINLADKSGLDICEELKRSGHHAVIMMSAIDNLPLLARLCRADDYIRKPFSLTDIKSKVDLLLNSGRTSLQPAHN